MQIHRKHLHRREYQSTWRFLTCSCNHRLPLFDDDRAKQTFVECLTDAKKRMRFRLLAWVLMPEHFHLMLAPTPAHGVEGQPVSRILHSLKTPVSQRIVNAWSKSGNGWLARVTTSDGSRQFWQPGGGFDRNPRDLDELQREVRYIHHNPVKRGLVVNPIDWPWSSARWWAGLPDDRIQINSASLSRDWAM